MSEQSPDGSAKDKQKPANGERKHSLYSRFRGAAHRKFPSVFPDPYRHELLRQSRQRDEQDNAKTEPPADEVIDLRCIWAVEFYMPSQFPRLLRKFDELGWNVDDPVNEQVNPATWIRQFRERAHGGGWYNLGPIHRPGDHRYYPQGRAALLPSGVDYAVASMYSLTSSITCIVIGFLLDDTYSRRFERAMRKKRQTKLVPLPGRGYRILGPVSQKEDGIKAIRGEVRGLATDWFRSNLPGFFAGKNTDHEFPTCEFVTLQQATPFPSTEESDPQSDEWLRLLGFEFSFETWCAEELPGVKFACPLSDDRDNRFHAVIAAREDALSKANLQAYGGMDRSSYVIYMDRRISDLLSRWGLLGVLSGFERHLNTIRDSAAFDPQHAKQALPIIEAFRNHVAQSADISTVATDLKRFAEKTHQFEHNVESFKPSDKSAYRDPDITLGKALREQLAERAQWLENIDRSVRNLLIQYGSILGAGENIKLQKQVGCLTWVLVVLTIAIVVLTVATA